MSEPSAITGLPVPHVAIHAVGMPATPLLHREAVLLEDAGQVLRRLEFLEAELAEAEHHVVHLLDVLAHRVDFEADVALELIELRVRAARPALRGCAAAAPAAARRATPIDSRRRRSQ